MRRKGMFVKITFYYMSILLCIMIVVSIALNMTFSSYKKDVVSAAQIQYQSFVEKMDMHMLDFSTTVQDMYVDRGLKREKLESGNSESINAIKKLKLYMSALTLAEELFISFDGEHLYSNSGSYRARTWAKEHLQGEDAERLLEALGEEAKELCMVVNEKNGNKGLLYLYTSPITSKNNYMQVGIYVSGSRLQELLKEVMQGRQGVTAFTLESGESIFSINHIGQDVPDRELLDSMLTMEAEEYAEYTIFHCKSDGMEYTVHVALQTEYLWERQLNLQMKILGVGLLFFLMIGVLFWALNLRFYHPIRALAKLAAEQSVENAEAEVHNEYMVIRTALEKNRERTDHHEQDIRFLRKELRKGITILFMSGGIREAHYFSTIIRDYGLLPEEGSFAVIGLFGTGYMQEAYESLQEDSDFSMCSLESLQEGFLLSSIVVLSDEDEKGEERRFLCSLLKEKVEESGSVCKGLASGTVYDSLYKIYHSYNEMCDSIETALLGQKFSSRSPKESAGRMREKVNDKVMDYIRENCLNAELSIEVVAERFSLPRQKISGIVKEMEGVTYIEYLSHLRCRKACELLESTSLTIQEIVQQVGWYDTRNFTRKFKVIYGITPGEYRSSRQSSL